MSALHVAPLIPLWLLVAFGLAGILLLLRLPWARVWPRLIPLVLVLLALINPRLIAEDSTALDNIALVIVDDSPSMALDDRTRQRDQALSALQDRLKGLPGLSVRVERVKPRSGRDDGTRLFEALDHALTDIPRRRLAGIVMITDGQVNDVPATIEKDTPLHVLLAGHRTDHDRRLVVERAPGFAIRGTSASLSVRIDDPGQTGSAVLTIRRDGGNPSLVSVPLNHPMTIDVPIDHPGANLVELEAAAAPGELTTANNRAVVSVTGVRERLRVLLISGEPHSGERTWRNLLKSDPAVDLVHFTILRGPLKDDPTPSDELALIPFPKRVLFEEKLQGFDLVILDRTRRALLDAPYYQALANYVRGGGALLAAAGPEFASTDESPAGTALQPILPLDPDGKVTSTLAVPEVTDLGQRHPVTAGLPGGRLDGPAHWGRWARFIGGRPKDWASTLMAGPHGDPLLSVGRVGDGRVALLMSDTAWLWDRGWEGGGPQQELLRRLAHWLMQEPELEEERLTARFVDDRLVVDRQSVRNDPPPVTATAPDGSQHPMDMTSTGPGRESGSLATDQVGLWRVNAGELVALAALGSANPIEMAEVRATEDKLKPLVAATAGGLRWIDDGPPAWRLVGADGPAASSTTGSGWLGLRARGEREVRAVRDIPMLPGWLLLPALLASLGYAWWREGR